MRSLSLYKPGNDGCGQCDGPLCLERDNNRCANHELKSGRSTNSTISSRPK